MLLDTRIYKKLRFSCLEILDLNNSLTFSSSYHVACYIVLQFPLLSELTTLGEIESDKEEREERIVGRKGERRIRNRNIVCEMEENQKRNKKRTKFKFHLIFLFLPHRNKGKRKMKEGKKQGETRKKTENEQWRRKECKRESNK